MGDVVCRIPGSREAGVHRMSWDLRYPAPDPVSLDDAGDYLPWEFPPKGPLVVPGTYRVTMFKEIDGKITKLAGPESFEVEPLNQSTFTAKDPKAVLAFQKKIADLHRAVQGTLRATSEVQDRITHVRKAILDTPGVNASLIGKLDSIETELNDLLIELRGDRVKASRGWPTKTSISERVENILIDQWLVTSDPTGTEHDGYDFAADAFAKVLKNLRRLIDRDLTGIEQQVEKAGGPWTPGRLPMWKK